MTKQMTNLIVVIGGLRVKSLFRTNFSQPKCNQRQSTHQCYQYFDYSVQTDQTVQTVHVDQDQMLQNVLSDQGLAILFATHPAIFR